MKKLTREEFIKRSRAIHGEKYGYDDVVYVDSHTKVKIYCRVCQEYFWQTPKLHMEGHGCCKCGGTYRKTREEFIREAEEKHNHNYDYSKVVYKGDKEKVIIICPEHGEFEQTPHAHLYGQGCPKCGVKSRSGKRRKTLEQFIEDAYAVHGNKYDYSKSVYDGALKKLIIRCVKHDYEFMITPNSHLNGCGCSICGNISRTNKLTKTCEEFIENARKVHGDKYDYSRVVYYGNKQKVWIRCKKHDEWFLIRPNSHLMGEGCPLCAKEYHSSVQENELFDFISSFYKGEIRRHDRKILERYELDFYFPELNLAIEFNGIHWHGSLHKPMDYHLMKTKGCEDKGIMLLHIFEDEWAYKREIVKARLCELFKVFERIVQASDCVLKKVDDKVASDFLEENCIHGDIRSSYKLGLFIKDEIVSLMAFNKSGKLDKSYEIAAFCNKLNINVVGGADRLLKKFTAEMRASTVIANVDRRWDNGSVYEGLGFTLVEETPPSFQYVKGNRRYNEKSFKELLSGANKTIHKNALNRVYDCGQLVFKWER